MRDRHSREARRSESAALHGFVDDISSQFCPFIAPAQKHQVLSFSDYTADELADAGRGDVTAGLLYLGIVHTERLRRRRTALRSSGQFTAASLICDNIVVLGSETASWRAAKDLVDWPHYLLKSVYSESELMFGKFWTEEVSTSLDGRTIPTTPATFLSIRSAVRLRDPELLREQAEFAAVIREASDDGQDVLLRRVQVAGADATPELLADRDCMNALKATM